MPIQVNGAYFLYAAVERSLGVGDGGYLVEVAVSADKEVKSEGELSECSSRLTSHQWLVVHL